MSAASAAVNPPLWTCLDMLAGADRARHVAQMTGDDKEREERLAAALRENLKRRKAQARAQQAPTQRSARPSAKGEDGS